ncbi:protein tramtrack, beta isoform-like isoform X1 [Cherax quadricarinatus]|uniref:protein tramtrack, beta isoform-like isoform X1 n=1 Tax=Cherax quadricarinatus TaxID=27406 RepID=UPI00387E7433
MFPFLIPHMVSSGVRMAMSPQQFCLRWNNHQSNIISVFEQLLQTESFVDVTLAVEGMTLKAHKVVLSACSPYFQAVLASHPDKHPIVILKDVRYTDMRDLLDFMYRGEVSVDQDNLSGFLRVAESLRIKGLTEVNEKKRLENTSASSAYLVPQAMPGAAPPGMASGVVPMAPLTPLAGDPPPLKRPPLSPSATYGAKRRRGRPPKISGEESEGEVGSAAGSLSAAEGEDTRSEAEVKLEVEDAKECQEPDDLSKEADTKSGESTPGPSGENQVKEVTRVTQEDQDNTRESPGSGHHPPEWSSQEYDLEDPHSIHSAIKNTSQPPPPHPPPVTDMEQLYYTKNLLEAAMLKNPYEALKNDKDLHGSILLASLRAPLKFGLHGVYEREGEREHIDSSPHSPHISSPQKPTQSSQATNSPSGGSGGNHNKVSVPIMSYCIQDNGFKCSKCFQTFTHPSNFHRHYITVHTDRRAHKCHVCGKEFKRKDNMMSHIRSVHRPGKEGHTIFRDVTGVSPSLARDVPHLQEQLMQQLQQVDKV